MTANELNEEYFDWMACLVSDKQNYTKLLRHLHSIVFTYIIPMDGNRAEDGIDLRYRFAHDRGYSDRLIASLLDNAPCSVLEMMVALSLRCEEHIMSDPEIGDRTGKWFWSMIKNLGLYSMTDTKFNSRYVDNLIQRFMDREYGHDGQGGLFTIHNSRVDMRWTELWYQMCWYINEMIEGENF